MRIAAVKTHLSKALEKIEAYATADTAYNASTLDKFEELSEMCIRMHELLASITHTDRQKTTDTAEKVDSMQSAIEQLTKQMASMQAQMDQISEKVNSTVNTPSIVVSTSTSESDSDTEEKTSIASVVVPSMDADTSTQIDISRVTKRENSENAKKAAKAYDDVLRKIAASPQPYYELTDLCRLLYDWHKKRFMDNYKYNCKFKYSYKRIRKLICLITIAYGYHVEHKDVEQFISTFRGFLDKIGTDPQTTDCFAVPYEINQMEKDYDSSYDNATAAALYYQLWDLGLGDILKCGLPIEYRPECNGIEKCFTSIDYSILYDANDNPEHYLTSMPTLNSVPKDKDWE